MIASHIAYDLYGGALNLQLYTPRYAPYNKTFPPRYCSSNTPASASKRISKYQNTTEHHHIPAYGQHLAHNMLSINRSM